MIVAVAVKASGSDTTAQVRAARTHRAGGMFFSLPMNLQSTDFEIFDIPQQFGLERSVLDERWKRLQREAHPDQHALADPQTQRQAMQWSVRINEAYQRLKDPLQRAVYLCELNGVPVESESNTRMPPDFLMQQMEWREALEEATTAGELEDMADEVAEKRRHMIQEAQRLADEQADFAGLAQQVRALMFVERFAHDVDVRLDQLGQ